MDFIRAGEALLRSSSQPLLPFLAPSAYLRPRRLPIPPPKHLSRYKHSQAPSQPSTSATTDEFSKLLDSALSSDKGVPTAPTGRTSRFASPSAQHHNSPSRLVARAQQERQPTTTSSSSKSTGSAVDELLETVLRTPQPPQRQRPTAPSTQFPGGSLDIAAMLDPLSTTSTFSSSTSTATRGPPPPAPPQVAPMKLNSSVGRTITVDNARGMDVAKAFRALEIQCARNSVRRDFMRQRFHERPGLKRKRLKSERWRKRFKENFRGTVAMVQRMRGQGW